MAFLPLSLPQLTPAVHGLLMRRVSASQAALSDMPGKPCPVASLTQLTLACRWAYLPYSMHMAGPREAIQHMIIRKNYGGWVSEWVGRCVAGWLSVLAWPPGSSCW